MTGLCTSTTLAWLTLAPSQAHEMLNGTNDEGKITTFLQRTSTLLDARSDQPLHNSLMRSDTTSVPPIDV